MKYLILLFSLMTLPLGAATAVDRAVGHERAGRFEEAFAIYRGLADAGDGKAMIDLGRLFYEGKGVSRDYGQAMEWWVKAFELGEGMAYNNIAVLYRDGLGVEKNLQIAWGLLFIGHMRGLGDQATVSLINHNLRKVVDLIPETDVYEACRWSEEYFKMFVTRKGADQASYETLKLDRTHPPVIILATY